MTLFLTTLPWLLMVAALPWVLLRRPSLASYSPAAGGPVGLPVVSIILPTRNDANRIGICLATLLDTSYPDYEVLVVDHGSTDGTPEIVSALASRMPARVRLIAVGPTPSALPWRASSCLRGAQEARGELLLFTDAGTFHDGQLLPRAVAALRTERADLLSVHPRLSMQNGWERLVMPHIWLMLAMLFPSARAANRSRSPRTALSNRLFLLFRRETYEAIGGHRLVTRGVLEDVTLAQAVVRHGKRVFLVHGESFLETRMYRTLGAIAHGWIAGVPPAARVAIGRWGGALAPGLLVGMPLVLFVVPPVVLVTGFALGGTAGISAWAAAATLLSLVLWLAVCAHHRIRPAFALAFPIGALITGIIFARGIMRDPLA